MKFFRLDLLTLLISLFILNSCKRQDGIGLGVDTATQISGNLLVDTNITIHTALEDSAAVVTSALTKTPLSDFVDPQFGTIKSNVALGLLLPTTPYSVPAGTLTIDSVVMVLPYADGFYGDSVATRYKVNVYQLAEKAVNQTYYATKHWSADMSNLLGTQTFTANTHDSVNIVRIRKDTIDTMQRVAPQVRIPFSKKFIYDNLFNASGSQLASDAAFQAAIKGLYVTLNRAQPSNAGGIIQLNLTSAHLDVFYKAVSDTTIDTATTTLTFPVHAADIRRTYNSTINAAINSTATTQSLFYLQGVGGLRAKVSFPGLRQLNPDSIVLNRVELVITPNPGSGIPYAPLPQLTMYQLDIAKQRIAIQDGSSADSRFIAGLFDGLYNTTKKEYHFVITSYVQDLIRKKTVDYGTYLAPIDVSETTTTGTFVITPSIQTAGRAVLVGNNSTSALKGFRIKLNVIYTKIPK